MTHTNLQPPEITADTPGMIWNGSIHTIEERQPRWEIDYAVLGSSVAVDLLDHETNASYWVATVHERDGQIRISTGPMQHANLAIASAWNVAYQWALQSVASELDRLARRRTRP